jgi:two-component system, NtrC family, C4-dicarboxylate transport sensor histidine kinase DctB
MMNNGSRGLLIGLWVTLMVMIAFTARQWGLESLRQQAQLDNERLAGQLLGELDKYRRLPALIATRSELKQTLLLQFPPYRLHPLLEQYNEILGTDAIYLMTEQGEVLSASNWRQQDSFVGDNYHFRPYFRQAMQGKPGSYFALGQRSGRRGYYFSYPVQDGDRRLGVVVVKVALSLIDERWARSDLDYLLTDEYGVVFFASQPDWLYRPLVRLDQATRHILAEERKYGDKLGAPLSDLASLGLLRSQSEWHWGQGYLFTGTAMPTAGWHLYTLEPLHDLRPIIAKALASFTLVSLLLLMIWLYWRQVLLGRARLARLNNLLEHKVNQRTKALSTSNQDLVATLDKFRQTQRELVDTQEQLVQTAKLALLGEMSAGINHELNQPLAAMRAYGENALQLLDQGRLDSCRDNLLQINDLNHHMSELVARFKVFARKGEQRLQAVALQPVVHASLSLLHGQMIKQGVLVETRLPSEPLYVRADAVQLEQVLVNLLHNALQACASSGPPRVWLEVESRAEQVTIAVIDNGPGLQVEARQLFAPFYTTKSQGLGLGLTISLRIITAFGGTLDATNDPRGGARFTITLPAVDPSLRSPL